MAVTVTLMLWLWGGEEEAPAPEALPAPATASLHPSPLQPETIGVPPVALPTEPLPPPAVATPRAEATVSARPIPAVAQPSPVAAQPAPAAALAADPTAGPAGHPESADSSGDLARQLAAFEVGEDQYAEGDHQAALTAYEAYLERWPNGHFRAEAELSRLRAVASLGDAAAAQRLAARLADDPALASRRAEILSLRLSALGRLGRCEEARALAAEIKGAAAQKVAAECR